MFKMFRLSGTNIQIFLKYDQFLQGHRQMPSSDFQSVRSDYLSSAKCLHVHIKNQYRSYKIMIFENDIKYPFRNYIISRYGNVLSHTTKTV